MFEKNRVAITGIGLVTPIGNIVKENWNSLINGLSGISKIDRFDLGDYPYQIAGLVNEDKELLDKILPFNKQRKTERFIHLAILAGYQAFTDSGLTKIFPENRERFGTCIGVGVGGVNSIAEGTLVIQKDGMRRTSPFLIPKSIINQAAAQLSMEWDLEGPISSIVNACSSSGDAVGNSFRLIRDGYADYMLTGGAESCITPLAVSSFGNMRSLSSWKGDPKKSCRPFDKDRSGFVMSEGSGILVLERMDLAKKRGANIYAEIIGYGSTADAFHVTAMQPDGNGAIRVMDVALKDAKVNKKQINYVNAHGTSTQMNDPIETKALKAVFGENILPENPKRILVSSTKSMTGHLLGAAGGAEISFTALALKNQVLPPTINLDCPDPECDLDYIAHKARETKVDYAISNSFGFGGGNSVVVLKRFFD